MTGDLFFYWFGVVHFVAYAMAGFLRASALFIDWLLRRLRLKREIIHAYARYLKDKHDGNVGA